MEDSLVLYDQLSNEAKVNLRPRYAEMIASIKEQMQEEKQRQENKLVAEIEKKLTLIKNNTLS